MKFLHNRQVIELIYLRARVGPIVCHCSSIGIDLAFLAQDIYLKYESLNMPKSELSWPWSSTDSWGFRKFYFLNFHFPQETLMKKICQNEKDRWNWRERMAVGHVLSLRVQKVSLTRRDLGDLREASRSKSRPSWDFLTQFSLFHLWMLRFAAHLNIH